MTDEYDAAVKDWNDALRQGHDVIKATDSEWARGGNYRSGSPILRPFTLEEFLALDLKPREPILDGLLYERGVNMFYAWRGVGKTWFGLELGYTVATGGTFLKWEAKKARRVLHIDGEMPAISLRDERLKPIIAAHKENLPDASYFRILPADAFDLGLPNLATQEGQQLVEQFLGDAEVITFDNVSTLFASGRENEAESWLPVQAWLLKLRRQGRAVCIVHHAGKGKEQRGTSRREDILDVVLNLRHPSDYEPSQGCRFEVHFEKARGLTGEATVPFEATLESREGGAVWTTRNLEDAHLAEILELKKEGMSVRDIARELGMSKSAVQRAVNKGKSNL